MLISAFVLDVGMSYAQAQAFATSADSGALAIANAKRKQLTTTPGAFATCDALRLADGGSALQIAKTKADANGPFGLKASSGQVDVQVSLSCVDKDGNASATGLLRADVTVQRQVPTTFGKFAGVSSLTATRSASAIVGGAKSVNGLFPLAICNMEANLIQAGALVSGPPYANYTVDIDKVWKPGCDGKGKGSGNWGWLDCGGGVSVPAIADAITNGCDSAIALTGGPPSTTVDGAPGNKFNSNNIKTAMDGALGQIYAFPVYDTVTGNGANTSYRVIGFVELKLVSYTSDGSIVVQYVNYSPVGQINTACGIGILTCSTYNTYAARLIN